MTFFASLGSLAVLSVSLMFIRISVYTLHFPSYLLMQLWRKAGIGSWWIQVPVTLPGSLSSNVVKEKTGKVVGSDLLLQANTQQIDQVPVKSSLALE